VDFDLEWQVKQFSFRKRVKGVIQVAEELTEWPDLKRILDGLDIEFAEKQLESLLKMEKHYRRLAEATFLYIADRKGGKLVKSKKIHESG
jgi:hypothetical protein